MELNNEVRKCRKCGAVLTALEGVQIEMRKRKRWITLDIPLCEKHQGAVWAAVKEVVLSE